MKIRNYLLMLLSLTILFSSCYKKDIEELKDELAKQQELLKTYGDLLAALQNKLTITGINTTSTGYNIVLSDGRTLTVNNGVNGQTPVITIGSNGNWYVNGQDTGSSAQGEAPEIEIGPNGHWFINGVDSGHPSTGADAPHIIGIAHVGGEIVFYFSNGESISIPFDSAEGGGLYTSTKGVYVLSEGLMGAKNSKLTYYDFTTGTLKLDYFKTVNGYDLGETANDMKRYGGKLYITVSGLQGNYNGFVEVLDVNTAKSLKRIPFSQGTTSESLPRFIAHHKGKVYISCYDGTIARIDTSTLRVEAKVQAGGALEGMTISNNKIYVTNSNHPYHPYPSPNTLSVIDIASFTKMYEIDVVYNPVRIVAGGNQKLYVMSWGNYSTIQPAMNVVSSQTDDATGTLPYNIGAMALTGDSLYLVGDWGSWIRVYNTTTETMGSDFITDGTSISTPYAITVNPQNKDVYIADANWYSGPGRMLVFGNDGKKKLDFETGEMPNYAVFLYE